MELGLNGKTALVTGASRGIGLAIAQLLADEGVKVVGAARTITPELEKVAAATVATDLSTREGATGVVERAVAAVGGIDLLVNNVGAGDPDGMSLGGFLEVPDEQWQSVFDLNLFSLYRQGTLGIHPMEELAVIARSRPGFAGPRAFGTVVSLQYPRVMKARNRLRSAGTVSLGASGRWRTTALECEVGQLSTGPTGTHCSPVLPIRRIQRRARATSHAASAAGS